MLSWIGVSGERSNRSTSVGDLVAVLLGDLFLVAGDARLRIRIRAAADGDEGHGSREIAFSSSLAA